MPRYFDPTRRAVVTPAPVAVKSAAVARVAPGHYFDPTRPRAPRSVYPTQREIDALVVSFDPVLLRVAEQLKQADETVAQFVARRVAWAKRCQGCGALGEGEFGHRSHCPLFREWRFLSENWWFGRARSARTEATEEDDDDSLAF